jgi:hypothetical protein
MDFRRGLLLGESPKRSETLEGSEAALSPKLKRREIGVNWKERSCSSLLSKPKDVIKCGFLKKKGLYSGKSKYSELTL